MRQAGCQPAGGKGQWVLLLLSPALRAEGPTGQEVQELGEKNPQ